MRRFLILLLVAFASAELAPLFRSSEPVPGKYVIKLKDGINVDDIATKVRLSGGKVGHMFRHAVNGFAAALSDRILDMVRSLPAVEYVEEEGVYRTQGATWGLDRIDQRDLPLNNAYQPFNTNGGEGYVVYVIDTGVRASHNEFNGRAEQVVDLIHDSSNAYYQQDCHGHGTHCAGTVGADSYGVANKVEIRGVKVFGCNGETVTGAILAGVDYVTDTADKDNSIASMSLRGPISLMLDNAVSNMIDSGVPTAMASGNDNQDACNFSPGRIGKDKTNGVTVGATRSDDNRYFYSNWGDCVDLVAPGVSVTSTWWTSDTAINTITGTSMACPHVAGALALYGRSVTAMMNAVTLDKISVKNGTPNKLLYVGN